MTEKDIGQTIAQKYRIESLMRTGHLANLYRASHLLMNRRVAIKVLSRSYSSEENLIKQFSDEANILSKISHPNIQNVHDFGLDTDGTRFIVLEDAAGETLETIIKRDGAFTLERANAIISQISDALSHAHSRGVVHAQLTSERILISKKTDGSELVKIIDFGDQYLNDYLSPKDELYEAQFLSPEQCGEQPTFDARSNIYSLGVILYEMLTGDPPFTGESKSAIMLKHIQEPSMPVSSFRENLSPKIEDVILHSLAKNPEYRYQNAGELAHELDQIARQSFALMDEPAEEALVSRQEIPSTESLEEIPEGNIWKTAFIVLAGIVILSSFLIYFTRMRQVEPVTQLPIDANGTPVQPVNPASGAAEDSLANMSGYAPDNMGNSGFALPPGAVVNDPWARGGVPPKGSPNYGVPFNVQPGGQVITINPNTNSPFMPQETTVDRVPVTANVNANVKPSPKPTPSPKTTPQVNPTPVTSSTPSTEVDTQKPTTQPVRPREIPTKPKAAPNVEKPQSPPTATDKNGAESLN